MSKIPALIRKYRKQKNMTLADAAGKLGISVQYWCQVETEVKQPTLDQLIRMAKVVGLDVKVSVQ